MPTENGITPLAWLKEFPGQSFPKAFLKVIKRLERIRDIDLSIDTTDINFTRLRQLAKIGARYEPYGFRRFDDEKRYSILVAFLLENTQNLIDQAIEIHDRQMMNLQLRGI
ncbi:hypothetical protein COI41_26920 [Bacillus toyonensis]|nr:hypothetical protein CN567_26300 [Bacillus toyonensis]PFX75075.1 hypothetical protein COL38_29950 [Bacillus toyonensis]PFX78425.1 hypothetical protein COL37_24495 [Bacillus toyonensis]PGB02875.1 hypothetical protein COL98_29190 [Bacillus toyonensis]PHF49995.1 hypothetical protein COI41_26920 [Bacillus toyonensis]